MALCRGPKRTVLLRQRWKTRGKPSKKRWYRLESKNKRNAGSRRAGRGCKWKGCWRKKRNDARNPRAEMAVAAPRGLGPGRPDFPDRRVSGDFFWQRTGESAAAAADRGGHREENRRASGVASGGH